MRPFFVTGFCNFSVMKHLILSFSVFVLSQPLLAQTDFCVPGATWVYYDAGNQAVNYEIENYVQYTADTTIGVFDDVKILRTEKWYQFNPQIPIVPLTQEVSYSYVRQQNDSILKFVDGNWELMFDYNAQQGDSVLVFVDGWEGCNEVDTMIIDSVYLSTELGMQVRRYDYRLLILEHWADFGFGGEVPEQYTDGVPGSYCEKLGFPIGLPVHQPANCEVFGIEYMPVPLVCYTDDELIGNGVQPCSLVLSSPVEMKKSNVNMTLTSEHLLLQNVQNSTLRIYDTLGKELFQGSITSDNQSFDVSHLPNGILVVVLEGESGRLSRRVFKASQ